MGKALSAILYLYREVLAIDLPWLDAINRATRKPRIPSVLTQAEVAGILAQMDEGITALLTRLLYGTGLRLIKAMRLRIKDVDFARQVNIAAGLSAQLHADGRGLASINHEPGHATSCAKINR